jgi:hypothetical protein
MAVVNEKLTERRDNLRNGTIWWKDLF